MRCAMYNIDVPLLSMPYAMHNIDVTTHAAVLAMSNRWRVDVVYFKIYSCDAMRNVQT